MKKWKVSKFISVFVCLTLLISFFTVMPQNKAIAGDIASLGVNFSGTSDFTKYYGGDIDSTTLKFKTPIISTLTYNINPQGVLDLPAKSSDVVLVFDISNSMDGAKLTSAKKAAKDFVDSLYNKTGGANDNVGIVAFGTKGYRVAGMTQLSNTTNVAAIESSIGSLTALKNDDGKADLHEGLLVAKNIIGPKESTKNKYIIVVTDSVPDSYTTTSTISGYKLSTTEGATSFYQIDESESAIKTDEAVSKQKPKDIIDSMKKDDNIDTYALALTDGANVSDDTALSDYIGTVPCAQTTVESDMGKTSNDLINFANLIGGNDVSINNLTITQKIPDGCEVDNTTLPAGWTFNTHTNTLTGIIDKINYNDRAASPITKQIKIRINTPGVFKFTANYDYTDPSGAEKTSALDSTKAIIFPTIKVFPKIKVLYVHGSGETEEFTNSSDTRIDVDSMSIQQFISQTLMDINGKYDIIYFGKGVYFGANDPKNTGEQVPGYNFTKNELLDTTILGANVKDPVLSPNGLSNMNGHPTAKDPNDLTISPYDITNKMAKKVDEFIDSNQPVIFNTDTLDNTDTNFYSEFHTLDFQDNDLSKYTNTKKNVWKVTSLSAGTLVDTFEKIDYHRPCAYIVSKPITDPTNDMTNTTDPNQNNFMYTPSNNLLKYTIVAYNFNNNDPLSVQLYLDKNADGKYTDGSNGTKNEKVQTWSLYSGSEQQFTYPMPDEYMGRQFWKLSVVDTKNRQDNYTDSFLFRGSKMIKMRVLQLIPDTSSAAKSSNLRALFQKKAVSTDTNSIGKIPGMFEIDVDPIYASDFNNGAKKVLDSHNNYVDYAENWQDQAVDALGNTVVDASNRVTFTDSAKQRLKDGYYDMLIVGFDDTYAKGFLFNSDTINVLKDYINNGRPVMFSHDNFEGDNVTNQDIRNNFLEIAGQKWQSTKYAYKGQGFWSDPYSGIFKKQLPSKSSVGFSDVNSYYVKNVNQGVITTFPYMLSNWDSTNYGKVSPKTHNTINISGTHIQYYRLNLENVDPWYNMIGGNYIDSDDSVNSYYTYSCGAITFSGTGHNPGGFINAPQELELFANTVFKTYNGGNHAPGMVIESPADGQKVPSSDTKIHNVKLVASDYDGDSSEPLYIKVWIDRKDTANNTPSTVDSDWDQVTLDAKALIVDTNDDGIADSKPLGITTDGYIIIPNGSRLIFDVNKGLETISDDMESRNVFLKFKVKDSDDAADDKSNNHCMSKTIRIIDNNGAMLKVTPDSNASVMMNAIQQFNLTMEPSGTYRIPNSTPNVMNNINVTATIWKKNDAGTLDPVTDADVEIEPSADANYSVSAASASAGTLGNPAGTATLAAQIRRNENVVFEPDPAGVYSSNKEKPSIESLNNIFKLKFKNRGIYVIKYQPSYDLGTNESVTPGLPWGLQQIPVSNVVQDVDGQDTTVNVTSSIDDILLSTSNTTARANSEVSLALKFKFGFDANSVKLYFDEAPASDGSVDSSFSITNDADTLKGFNNGTAMTGISAGTSVDGNYIDLGNILASGAGPNDLYEIKFNAKMTLLAGKKNANDLIRFSKIEYKDTNGMTHTISLTDVNDGTSDLKDQSYLPNYKYNAGTQALDAADASAVSINAVPMTVYVKIRLG